MYIGAHIHVQYSELCEEYSFYSAHSQNCEKWLLALSCHVCLCVCPSIRLFVCPSIHMEKLSSTEQIFMKFDVLVLFKKSINSLQVTLKSYKNNEYFTCRKTYIHLWKYLTHFFLEWERFQMKHVEKMKIHILCSITFFWKLYLLYDNVGEYDRTRQVTDDNIIWCLHCACLITNATDTHLEYVTLTAFPWQQWLHERTSVLHLCIRCLSFFIYKIPWNIFCGGGLFSEPGTIIICVVVVVLCPKSFCSLTQI